MKYLLSLMMICMLTAISAQEDTEPAYTRVGVDYLYHNNKMETFSQTLVANGFQPMEDHANFFNFYSKSGKASSKWMGTFGFSFYQRSSISLRNILTPFPAEPTNTADILGFGLNSGLEYRLIDSKFFFVNPGFSVGLDYYKLAFTEGLEFTNLGQVLNNDINTYSASSFQVPLNFGIKAGVNIPIRERVVSMTVSGGYRLHLDNRNWNVNDVVKLDDEINLSSLYFGLGMEIGLFEKKK